jgi:hypothetical protein
MHLTILRTDGIQQLQNKQTIEDVLIDRLNKVVLVNEALKHNHIQLDKSYIYSMFDQIIDILAIAINNTAWRNNADNNLDPK